MNPTAIYSKSGKGVQEASGKTSLLKRPDRAVLSAIDGRANLQEVAQKCGKTFDPAFQALITQLDKDGFIREVSAGAGPAASKPAAVPPKPAAKPAAKPADSGGGDLDFSSLSMPSRPAAPPSRPAAPPKPAAPTPPVSQALDFSSLGAAPKQQVDALTKAREEAEAKAAAEREKMRAEAEAKTRAELEAKLRAEAEKKLKEKAESDAAADAKVKAAREAALKAAEAKVKAEQEAKAKIEAERKAREETEKRLEAERKAREEAEKKAKHEAERARKEAEEKARKEQEELKQRLEAERKAREEAERKAKEEAERARKELEEERKRLEAERKKEEEERAARRKKEEEEAAARRKKQEEEDRKAEEEREAKRRKREEEEAAREAEENAQREAKRKQREAEEAAREAEEQAKRETEREAKRKKREQEEAERERVEEELRAEEKRKKVQAPKAEGKKDSFADSLLADLDSFNNREEEEAKAKADEERKNKAEAERRQREEAERQAKEEAERRRAEQEEARRKEEEARRAREEEERRAQEEERRKREAEEIRRKAEAATAAAMAKEGKAPVSFDDIPISDDDLGMDEVKKEKAALAKARPKEEEEPAPPPPPKPVKKKKEADDAPVRARRPGNWGKKLTVAAVLLLVIGVGVLHVMPISTTEYERAATEALGRPVKIGSAKLWLFTGPQVRLSDVTVGDAKISQASASIGSAFSDRKELGTIELDGLTLPQQSLGDAIFATVRGDNFTVERIIVKNLQLPGPAVLPKSLYADIQLDGQGALRAANLRGPDGLFAKLTPKDSSIEFDVIAAGFTLPIAPEITLSKFAMKGTATPRGMNIPEWGGAIFNGGISGTANVRWGGTWSVEGVVTVRGINAAVFAPALLSGGTGEGTGRFSMSGADPAKLAAAGRLDGNFTVTQGTLGSFDLARAIQSNGKTVSGTTQFVEMNGQAVYDRGAVALRNVTIGAGALNAGASADIASSGALSGRIVADVKAASQIRSATLLLGGTVKEPQVRN